MISRTKVVGSSTEDNTINLIRQRYGLTQTYEQSFGITTDATRGVGTLHDADSLISEIMTKFDTLAAQCDVVLVEGTDYTGASAAFEFELNVTMALNLAAPVLLSVSMSRSAWDCSLKCDMYPSQGEIPLWDR